MKKYGSKWTKKVLPAVVMSAMLMAGLPSGEAAIPGHSSSVTTSVLYDMEKPARIAYTADGNAHDQDDWAGTAASLAILSAAGLQGQLVHYDYNDNVADHTALFPMSFTQEMRDTVTNAVYYFGYPKNEDVVGATNKCVFYDDSLFADNAVKHLTNEIEKSTTDNPLYIILGGPAEILYRAWTQANHGKDYVKVISHSQWNEWAEADGRWCKRGKDSLHTLADCNISLEKGNLIRIQDQNTMVVNGVRVPAYCITSSKTKAQQTPADYKALYGPVEWMNKAKNPGLNYIYQRLVDMTREEDNTDKADISDCGMVLYLLTGVQDSNYAKLHDWFNKEQFTNTDKRINKKLNVQKLNTDAQEVSYQDTSTVFLNDVISTSLLPTTIDVILGDNKTHVKAAASWSCISNRAVNCLSTGRFAKAGTFVFKGKITMPAGYTNEKGVAVYKVVKVINNPNIAK